MHTRNIGRDRKRAGTTWGGEDRDMEERANLPVPYRQIRALHTDRTFTVYQAYSPVIAERALEAGTFVPPFSRGRATWIKPSFLWMAYRSGWAGKHGQERILAIDSWRA
jgi:Domain of unknown function (DUF4291)